VSDPTAGPTKLIRQFREIVLWPLQLAPQAGGLETGPWEALRFGGSANPWREEPDGLIGEADRLPEAQYAEFVSFLPYVQRFLYGEGRRPEGYGESPIRVFTRDDVAEARVTLAEGHSPVRLQVAGIRLYFFCDVDVVIPVVELAAQDLGLELAQEILFQFGRAYPAFWEASGRGGRCPVAVEWLARGGEVLARSDYQNRDRYLSGAAHDRIAPIAAHWEWLLRPMVPDHTPEPGLLRYRQIEYYRMPLMGYLALDDPAALTRADFISIGLNTGPIDAGAFPFSAGSLARFEEDFCYDRYWAPTEPHSWSNTRFICSGHAFLMVGRHGDRFFADPDSGLLGQFRRQYFLLALIAHFHKAALLMFSDRLVLAISRLEVRDVESVKRFKRLIRRSMETFLRFTHRYWFHEVSTQDQARDLFRMWSSHLGTDRLYLEVREEIQDMSAYLNSDSLRRQANTVVRLTVVTALGLIATVATGILGMNLFAHQDEAWLTKVLYFVLAVIPTVLLILFAVFRAKALADFLETLSDERAGWGAKLQALRRVWRRK
jgi:CorA-like Mg2+ transporter protein